VFKSTRGRDYDVVASGGDCVMTRKQTKDSM
jgi:hypothetical protein